MRWRYLAASFVGHVAGFVALFVLVPPAAPLPPLDAIPVHIVGATDAVSAAAPAAPEEPEKLPLPAENTPNRPLDEVVKLPTPKKEAKTQPREEKVFETEGPVSGAPGLTAGVAVDAANFEFTYYLIALRNRIGKNWAAPAGLGGGQTVRAIAYFQIHRDGTVQEVRIEETSGHAFFDQSALRAVTISSPLPPLPLGFGGDRLGVHFAFEYEGR